MRTIFRQILELIHVQYTVRIIDWHDEICIPTAFINVNKNVHLPDPDPSQLSTQLVSGLSWVA